MCLYYYWQLKNMAVDLPGMTLHPSVEVVGNRTIDLELLHEWE